MKERAHLFIIKYLSPEVEVRCLSDLITNTRWPYLLEVYDNRPSRGPTERNMARLWNQFAERSNLDILGILDSDALVTAGWLEAMVRVFELEDVGVVVPKTNYCSEWVQIRPPIHNTPFVEVEGKVSGFCFLFKKQVWEEVEGFNEDYGFYGQDSDFFAKTALTTGWRVMVQPKAFVQHVGHYSTEHVEDSFDFEADKQQALERFARNKAGYLQRG